MCTYVPMGEGGGGGDVYGGARCARLARWDSSISNYWQRREAG